jgi:hypothetical protein
MKRGESRSSASTVSAGTPRIVPPARSARAAHSPPARAAVVVIMDAGV